jgi:hypothetical protein
MNTMKTLIVTTALASSFITTGFASKIEEDTDTLKRVVVKMGHEDTSPLKLDTEDGSWSEPEMTHRWAVGSLPGFTIRALDGEKRLSKITLNMAAFASDAHSQDLAVYFNENYEPFHEGTYKNMSLFQINFNLPADFAEEDANFLFSMPDITKPEVIDPSNKDGRKLGFSFTDIELEYTKK